MLTFVEQQKNKISRKRWRYVPSANTKGLHNEIGFNKKKKKTETFCSLSLSRARNSWDGLSTRKTRKRKNIIDSLHTSNGVNTIPHIDAVVLHGDDLFTPRTSMGQHVAIGAERYTGPAMPSATQTRVGQSQHHIDIELLSRAASVIHLTSQRGRRSRPNATNKLRELHRHRPVAPFANSDNTLARDSGAGQTHTRSNHRCDTLLSGSLQSQESSALPDKRHASGKADKHERGPIAPNPYADRNGVHSGKHPRSSNTIRATAMR